MIFRNHLTQGGPSFVDIGMFAPGSYSGQMEVDMSWYSWIIVMNCATAKFIWAISVMSSLNRVVNVCDASLMLIGSGCFVPELV